MKTRYLLWSFVCGVIFTLAMGAGDDPNEATVPVDINDLRVSVEEKESKCYIGTASDIFAEMVADQNEVVEKAKVVAANTTAINESTRLTAKGKAIAIARREAVANVAWHERKLADVGFLQAITDGLNPATLDVNDPNYAVTVAEWAELRQWCYRIVGPMVLQPEPKI